MAQRRNNGHRRPDKRPQKKEGLYTAAMIRAEFGLSGSVIDRYFPEPILRRNPHGTGREPLRLWTRSMIDRALQHPKVAEAVERNGNRSPARSAQQERIREFLSGFDAESMRRHAMTLDRRFVLHIGPTNSGKTYQAMQALKAAESGVYLGPLRLLALEMYDSMNRDGVLCDLLTGEEAILREGSAHTASTIELADLGRDYRVAVIDEAQMVTDPFRGDKWLRAIYGIRAEEVHICLAPEARELILGLLDGIGAPCEVVEHRRLAPLVFSGLFRSAADAQPGDALIVFSRRAVLALSAELEQRGMPASVIYGALPPVSRREEVRRFTEGETKVVVATDAIGMGVSLPIRRIIFCETGKFDGRMRRPLTSGEIKQVAGRAGRYGIFDLGEVLTMADTQRVRSALVCEEEQKGKLIIPFPEEALASDYPMNKLMIEWNRLPKNDAFSRADMTDALLLYTYLAPYAGKTDRKLIYRLITCPVDVKEEGMILYWLDCCRCILKHRPLPEPPSGSGTLEECEARYRELDIRHQLLRQIGTEEDRMAEKLALCETINWFLKEHKDEYLRHCRQCGRILPATHPYGLCEKCFEMQNGRYVYRPGRRG